MCGELLSSKTVQKLFKSVYAYMAFVSILPRNGAA